MAPTALVRQFVHLRQRERILLPPTSTYGGPAGRCRSHAGRRGIPLCPLPRGSGDHWQGRNGRALTMADLTRVPSVTADERGVSLPFGHPSARFGGTERNRPWTRDRGRFLSSGCRARHATPGYGYRRDANRRLSVSLLVPATRTGPGHRQVRPPARLMVPARAVSRHQPPSWLEWAHRRVPGSITARGSAYGDGVVHSNMVVMHDSAP